MLDDLKDSYQKEVEAKEEQLEKRDMELAQKDDEVAELGKDLERERD